MRTYENSKDEFEQRICSPEDGVDCAIIDGAPIPLQTINKVMGFVRQDDQVAFFLKDGRVMIVGEECEREYYESVKDELIGFARRPSIHLLPMEQYEPPESDNE